MRVRQKKFYHRILHKILHLPDILNVFISLELVAVDGFEVGARRCTSEHHRVKKNPLPLIFHFTLYKIRWFLFNLCIVFENNELPSVFENHNLEWTVSWRHQFKNTYDSKLHFRLSSGDKAENNTVYGVDPPQERAFLGGGKGISIFFNFCPITMIQNVNLIYIEWLIRFLKHHTSARALARAKIHWNLGVFQKTVIFSWF